MIEATCAACGTLNRVAEANVPVGAKFVTCAGCKARVSIGGPTISSLPPPIPRPPQAKPAESIPLPAKPAEVIDLADLPAPKRNSALGPLPATPAAKGPGSGKLPPPRSGLAAALDPELPAPKTRTSVPPSLELDELPAGAVPASVPAGLMSNDGGIDLPAPKSATRRMPELAAKPDVVDLPAPKARGMVDLPAPKLASKKTLADVAPPPAKPAIVDLPAPKRGPMIPDLPAPPRVEPQARNAELPAPGGFFDDLPQPNAAGAELPAPKGFFDDLPAPSAGRAGTELPAPKGFFDDLPQPAAAAPRGATELAPKGFFDDLPQPATAPSVGTDLAPKGFFDDLPRPAPEHARGGTDLPAPKGFFEDLPQVKSNPSGGTDVPAPKGYFDDIPGLPNTSKPEVPAPKGYFENVPGLPHTQKPEVPAPKGFFDDVPGLPRTQKPEVPAPKGFFENVPGLPNTSKPEVPAPKGFFDDLPQSKKPAGFAELPLPPPRPTQDNLQLDGPELDLIAPEPASQGFDELDLSAPSHAPRSQLIPVTTSEPAAARFGEPRFGSSPIPVAREGGLELELEQPAAMPKARPVARAAGPAQKPLFEEADVTQAKAKRKQRLLGGVLAAALLGGGGFFYYQHHAAQVAREESIAQQLQIARKSYTADDAKHWQRAANAARQVVELDPRNAEALGIGAETLLASALSDGTGAPGKLAQARKMLDDANEAGITSPQLTRARALAGLAAKQPDGAIAQLTPLVNQAPKDGALALYLGWALAAKGDTAGAIKAFDTATATPSTKLAALYGRGNARLALADLEGARADFAAVLEIDKDHIAAQVGLAAAEPPSAAEQQEADLLAILARKDIGGADPRAVALAWSRAGEAASRAGRYDVARDRFKKALAAAPADLSATTGLAEVELRDGKLPAAAELAAQALALSKDDVPAQLVQSELEVAEHKLPLAAQRLAAVAAHPTPLAPLDQARLQLITGRLLEAQGKDDEAIDAYVAGAKAARDLDLAPMMAAVDKLAVMILAADSAKNTARADELRGRSDQLLGELATQAEHDPKLALRLGQAYLQSGAADKAEPWLRKAVAALPTDAEAKFQLGRALLKSNKTDDALETLKAAMAADPSRADIGVALARAYEAAGRDSEAGALYGKLLTAKDPSLELHSRAGRFYARTGALDKAGAQGVAIVAIDPDNAAGLYLKGEGLLAAGKAVDAKQAFQRASEVDHDPQYYDALGRAAEALAQGGDRELQDLALRSYQTAAEGAPQMFNPLAGQGRLYVARHEAAKAVPPLLAAAKLDAKSAEVMYLIGASYQELQQAATALQWLEAAARLAPDARTYWKIGQIDRDTNQGAAAGGALANATRLAAEAEKRTGKPVPWLTDALYLRGRVALDLHDEATARDAWQLYVARNPPPSAQLSEVKQQLATTLRGR